VITLLIGNCVTFGSDMAAVLHGGIIRDEFIAEIILMLGVLFDIQPEFSGFRCVKHSGYTSIRETIWSDDANCFGRRDI